jgi:histidine kinase-like protein
MTEPPRDYAVPQTVALATMPVRDRDWPLHSYLELGALPTAVPCARLHARQVLWEWRIGELAETAEAIVCELVTNAVRASQDLADDWHAVKRALGIPAVRLSLFSDRQRVIIQVWDGHHQMPVPQAADPDAESGRGLLLVEYLSAKWGVFADERSGGKVVWALAVRPGEAAGDE